MTNFHPFFVHFPLALLAAALACEALAIIFRSEELSRAGWWNQLLGSLGLVAAILSGLSAEKSVTLQGTAKEIFGLHEQIAFLAAALFSGLLLWRIGTKTRVPEKLRWLYLALLCAGVALMLYGAWLGGEMVYGHGTGVSLP
jgi:uncharacterized membrane protein